MMAPKLRRHRAARVVRCLTAALLLLAGSAVTACSASTSGGSLTVLASWTGGEGAAFQRVLQAFTARTGIRVDYTGTSDAEDILSTDVSSGNPPDLAVFPRPGDLRTYASDGALHPLDGALDTAQVTSDYSPTWVDKMTWNGHYYGVIVKASLKSLIWYDPDHLAPFEQGGATPSTLTDLIALDQRISQAGGTPWCMGLADTSVSGWPGTDWIEDIMLHTFGPQVYQQWADGTLPWSSSSGGSSDVQQAWETWGRIIDPGGRSLVYGGAQSALLTGVSAAGDPMAQSQPGCYLDHEASFTTSGGTTAPGAFGAFSFPSITPQFSGDQEVAGDLMGMFRDTPQARALVAFLATPEAQAIWPSIPGSGAFTVNRQVPIGTTYQDPVSRHIAETLVNASDVSFDASDQMSQPLQNAFFQGILEYLDNPTEQNLTSILAAIDRVRVATAAQGSSG